MIAVTLHVVTKPTEHDRFVAAARVLRDTTVQEPGNIEYSLWLPVDGGNEVVVVERWRDDEAMVAHTQTDHMAAFRAAVKGAVAAPPTSVRADLPDAD